jgi:hypothetical protein
MATKTVHEWALEKGQVNKNLHSPEHDLYKPDHAVAAARHGWNWYEKNYGALELTEEEYLDALAFGKLGKVCESANRRNGPLTEKE